MIAETHPSHSVAAPTPAVTSSTTKPTTALWASWSAYFDGNRAASDLSWEVPPHLPEALRVPLAASLAVFQLGESGDGSTLRRFAKRVADDPRFAGYEIALTKFLEEENRHANTLRQLVTRLDGQLLERQWTHAAFKKLRRLINLEFELQILMTAEFIAEAYYAILRERAQDPVVKQACERILRDEVNHLRFHGDFFAARQQAWPAIIRQLWTWQCGFIFLITAHVVWFDHRPCFRALNTSYRDFLGLGKRSIETFMRRIDRQRTRLSNPSTRRSASAWPSA